MSAAGWRYPKTGAARALPIDLEVMLRAYAHGIFPMSDARDDPATFWVEPKQRAVLPLEGLHISHSLAKAVRQDRFKVTADQAFAEIIATCAADAEDRQETWINADIEQAFVALHEAGHAHSIECWHDGRIVGGLYGLSLGRVFFGESMFSRTADASKVALVWLVARLRLGGFQLLDCQLITDHLARLGVKEISQEEYLVRLGEALLPGDQALGDQSPGDQVSTISSSTTSSASSSASSSISSSAGGADWGALEGFLGLAGLTVLPEGGDLSGASSSPGKLILQLLTQMS
ncbi:MAG: leucyl/phenylalanyl-tRNA--protein transferase [Sphingorhabdus sp.]